jgi:fido (protein-threonine AMPylation protein)
MKHNVIVEYCAREVERQKAGPLSVWHMYEAWMYCGRLKEKGIVLGEIQIRMIGAMVNGYLGAEPYRIGPAVFDHGVAALAPEHISRQMLLLVKNQKDCTPDDFTKRFLDIHPFKDGNGRTASLIRNLLVNTLNKPTMLPFYYGE